MHIMRLVLLFLWTLLGSQRIIITYGWSFFSEKMTPLSPSQSHVHGSDASVLDRRHVVARVATSTTTALVWSRSTKAHADAGESGTSNENVLTTQSILQGLRRIPTFCIVNEQGAAYMLYQPSEGFAKGYAFLSYQGAEVVLKDALETAKKGGYSATWETATITTIPADVALRLTVQPKERISQKDQTASTVLFLIPDAADREAALQLDKARFKDQGKVPLFYLDSFRNSAGALPLYFSPRSLVDDWRQQIGGDEASSSSLVPPRIQVIDLITFFGYVFRGRQRELPTVLQTTPLAFVARPDSIETARSMQAKGSVVPYQLNRMVV